MQSVHSVEYLAVEKRDVLTHTTMWMDFKNIMLSEEARHKGPHIP